MSDNIQGGYTGTPAAAAALSSDSSGSRRGKAVAIMAAHFLRRESLEIGSQLRSRSMEGSVSSVLGDDRSSGSRVRSRSENVGSPESGNDDERDRNFANAVSTRRGSSLRRRLDGDFSGSNDSPNTLTVGANEQLGPRASSVTDNPEMAPVNITSTVVERGDESMRTPNLRVFTDHQGITDGPASRTT